MNSQSKHRAAIRTLQVLRISTDDPTTASRQEKVDVIVETPLLIDVEGVAQYTVLCTPIDKRFLAVGFLFSEGVIDSLDELAIIQECEDEPNTVRIKLSDMAASRNAGSAGKGRNLVVVSSCGACGSEEFSGKLEALPKVGNTLCIQGRLLRAATSRMSGRQPLFESCGGTHWAGIFNGDGEIVAHAEDSGRHNALDKAIGGCLLGGVPVRGCWAVLSGRVSLEMVSKCARAGIELIAALSAPTSLAVETSERCGITLCAFVRETRATVFSHPERIA